MIETKTTTIRVHKSQLKLVMVYLLRNCEGVVQIVVIFVLIAKYITNYTYTHPYTYPCTRHKAKKLITTTTKENLVSCFVSCPGSLR